MKGFARIMRSDNTPLDNFDDWYASLSDAQQISELERLRTIAAELGIRVEEQPPQESLDLFSHCLPVFFLN